MARVHKRDALAVGAILILLVGWWLKIRELFPQVEFIDWIVSPLRATFDDGVKAMVTFRHDGFSRHVSIIWAAGTGRACGSSIPCINTMAFLPVAGAALAFYALARVVRLGALTALTVVVVWLVSEPTFEVLTWQATLHDRLAALFVPGMLLAVVLILRRLPLRAAWAVPAGGALAAAGLLAVNTKEPAWVLLPMVVAAPLVLGRSLTEVRDGALILAPAALLMAIHVITDTLALRDDPASQAHVSGGDVWQNLPILSSHAVPGGLFVVLPLLALAMYGAVEGWRHRDRLPEAAEGGRYGAWLGIGAVFGWVIPARTEFASAFYMLVPLAVAAIAIACGLRALLLVHRPVAPWRVLAGAGAAYLALVCVGVSLHSRWDAYGQVVVNDARFRKSLPELARIHAAHPANQFQFRMEYGPAARFVTASSAANFWRHVVPRVSTADYLHPSVTTADTCGSAPGVTVLSYDVDTRLVGACAPPPPRR